MARKTAKAFFQNEIYGLFRRARFSNQLVIPESLRERLIETSATATWVSNAGSLTVARPVF